MSSRKPSSSKNKDAPSPKDKDTSVDSEPEATAKDLLKQLKKAQARLKALEDLSSTVPVAADIPAPSLAGFNHKDFSAFNRLRKGYLLKCKLKRLAPDPIQDALVKFEGRVMAAMGVKDRDPLGEEWLSAKEEDIMSQLSAHFYAKASQEEIQNLYREIRLPAYSSYPSLVDSLDRFLVDITVLDRDLERAKCRALDAVTRGEILQSRLSKSPELVYFLRNRKFETFDQLLSALRDPIERLAAFHREFGPADGAPGTLVPGINVLSLSGPSPKSRSKPPVSLHALDGSEQPVPNQAPPLAQASAPKRARRAKRGKAPTADTSDTAAMFQAFVNAIQPLQSSQSKSKFVPTQSQLAQRPCYTCDGKSHTMERCFARSFADGATGKCDLSKLSQHQRAELHAKIEAQRASSPRRSGRDTPARTSGPSRHAATSSDESSVNDDAYSASCVCARLVIGRRATAAALLDTGTTHNFIDPSICDALGTDILRTRKVSRIIRDGDSVVGAAKEESSCRFFESSMGRPPVATSGS